MVETQGKCKDKRHEGQGGTVSGGWELRTGPCGGWGEGRAGKGEGVV